MNRVQLRLDAGRASLCEPRHDAYLRLIKRLADKDANAALRVFDNVRLHGVLPNPHGSKIVSRYIRSAAIRQGLPFAIPATEVRRGDVLLSKGREGNLTILRATLINDLVRKMLIEWVGENGERGTSRITPTKHLRVIRPSREGVMPARLKTPLPGLVPAAYEFGRGRKVAWGEMEAYAARQKASTNSGTLNLDNFKPWGQK